MTTVQTDFRQGLINNVAGDQFNNYISTSTEQQPEGNYRQRSVFRAVDEIGL